MIDAANGDAAVTADADGRERVDDLGTLNTGFGTFKFYDIGAREFLGSSADSIPPLLVGVSPIPNLDGQLSSAHFSTIVLTFSEPLEQVSATSAAFYSLVGPGADGQFDTLDDVHLAWSSIVYLPDQLQVRLNLPQQLAQGLWRFSITGTPASAIIDRAGNALDADNNGSPGGAFSRTFQLDLTAPTVTTITPSGTATTATPTTSFTITFAENLTLNATTVTNAANYRLFSSPDDVFGNANDLDESARIASISYNPATRTATITLSGGPLPVGRYRLTLLPTITDTAGNQLNNGAPVHSALTITPADTTAPKLTAAPTFDWTKAPHSFSFTFSENVSASLSTADLVLVNLTTGQTLPASSLSMVYDGTSNTVTFSYTGTTNGILGMLPDGRYSATLLANGITDAAGNKLDGNGDGTAGDDLVYNFFFLQGDANHDARVDFVDLVALAQNYNTSGNKAWTQGNFNYDTAVDFVDLVALAQRYNAALPELPGPAQPIPGAAAMPTIEEALTMVNAGITPDTAQAPSMPPAPPPAPQPAPKPAPKPAPRPAAPKLTAKPITPSLAPSLASSRFNPAAAAAAAAAPRPFSATTLPIAKGPAAASALRDSVPGKVTLRYADTPRSAPTPIIFAPRTPVTKATLKAQEAAKFQDTILGSAHKSKVFATGVRKD
jgi:hypothetical protein